MKAGRLLSINMAVSPRPVMLVYNLVDGVTGTTIFGDQMLFKLDNRPPEDWVQFMKTFLNQTSGWSQGYMDPNFDINTLWMDHGYIPPVTAQSASLTLLDAGYNPLDGYYVTFKETCPLFREPEWWVDDTCTTTLY